MDPLGSVVRGQHHKEELLRWSPDTSAATGVHLGSGPAPDSQSAPSLCRTPLSGHCSSLIPVTAQPRKLGAICMLMKDVQRPKAFVWVLKGWFSHLMATLGSVTDRVPGTRHPLLVPPVTSHKGASNSWSSPVYFSRSPNSFPSPSPRI